MPSPSRPRLSREGLGRGLILRIARGLILRVAQGRLVHGPSPPVSADPPNNSSCLINASTTPAISAGRWLNATGWPTRPEVASAPYRPGQATVSYHCVLPLYPTTVSTTSTIPTGKGYDRDYRPLCPNAVPMIGRPLKASALYTGASAILGFVPAETPPPQCQPRHRPSLGLAHSPSTVACTFAAASTPRHSRGSHDAQDLMG